MLDWLANKTTPNYTPAAYPHRGIPFGRKILPFRDLHQNYAHDPHQSLPGTAWVQSPANATAHIFGFERPTASNTFAG